jgi:hypothetical protein
MAKKAAILPFALTLAYLHAGDYLIAITIEVAIS